MQANHATGEGNCEMCGLGVVVYPIFAIPVGAVVGAAGAAPGSP